MQRMREKAEMKVLVACEYSGTRQPLRSEEMTSIIAAILAKARKAVPRVRIQDDRRDLIRRIESAQRRAKQLREDYRKWVDRGGRK